MRDWKSPWELNVEATQQFKCHYRPQSGLRRSRENRFPLKVHYDRRGTKSYFFSPPLASFIRKTNGLVAIILRLHSKNDVLFHI